MAAFALDEGERVGGIQAAFPESLLASTARVTDYPAAGAADGPDLFIGVERFRETFCPDVPVDIATVLAATQRPLAAAAMAEPCAGAAWKTIPSWYLVSSDDNSIHPDAERFMAERIGASMETIVGSHAAFIAQPVATAAFILRAVAQVQSA